MMQVLKARQRWSDYSVLHIKNISMCLLTEKIVILMQTMKLLTM